MSDGAADETALVALVEGVGALRPDLDTLAALLLAAAHLGLSADSRSAARNLDVAHAHALRALASIEEAGLVAATRRDARTSRTHYALTEAGWSLMEAAAARPSS
ncbi:hypothetical protein [uncultured Methylobacterium sp.]|uniref:hypothetical protein n=1 Tax=uncultured Methylobacterium sp. TaxID=157278 RepID=UPI0035CB2329